MWFFLYRPLVLLHFILEQITSLYIFSLNVLIFYFWLVLLFEIALVLSFLQYIFMKRLSGSLPFRPGFFLVATSLHYNDSLQKEKVTNYRNKMYGSTNSNDTYLGSIYFSYVLLLLQITSTILVCFQLQKSLNWNDYNSISS